MQSGTFRKSNLEIRLLPCNSGLEHEAGFWFSESQIPGKFRGNLACFSRRSMPSGHFLFLQIIREYLCMRNRAAL